MNVRKLWDEHKSNVKCARHPDSMLVRFNERVGHSQDNIVTFDLCEVMSLHYRDTDTDLDADADASGRTLAHACTTATEMHCCCWCLAQVCSRLIHEDAPRFQCLTGQHTLSICLLSLSAHASVVGPGLSRRELTMAPEERKVFWRLACKRMVCEQCHFLRSRLLLACPSSSEEVGLHETLTEP